jgi:hypothetical protein
MSGNWSDPFKRERAKPGPKPRYVGAPPQFLPKTTTFLAQPKVRSSTKLVYLYLKTVGSGEMTINVSGMARWLGMSRSTVWRALLQLVEEGMIEWDRKGIGGSGWDRHGTVKIRRIA